MDAAGARPGRARKHRTLGQDIAAPFAQHLLDGRRSGFRRADMEYRFTVHV
jgi:hypothetical protein